jgi:hypothetical protein
VARGRPRGSTAFATQPAAPRLTAPLPLPDGSQEVIPATQPPAQTPAQPTPSTPSTPVGDSIEVAASQPTRGRGSRGGRVQASIQRTPSQSEGVLLEWSQMTAVGGCSTVPASSIASREGTGASRGGARPSRGGDSNVRNSSNPRGGPRVTSRAQKVLVTVGITKNKRST